MFKRKCTSHADLGCMAQSFSSYFKQKRGNIGAGIGAGQQDGQNQMREFTLTAHAPSLASFKPITVDEMRKTINYLNLKH